MATRRFDSLRQALRAFELHRMWMEELPRQRTRDSSLVCMPRERVDRTYRAANYLYRRVMRTHP